MERIKPNSIKLEIIESLAANGQIRANHTRGRLDLVSDETSSRKVSLRERADMEQQIGRKLKHFTDYASKESLGQVHVGGFLHNHIRRNPDGTAAPAQLQCRRKRTSRNLVTPFG
jgi:hypothetical protein